MLPTPQSVGWERHRPPPAGGSRAAVCSALGSVPARCSGATVPRPPGAGPALQAQEPILGALPSCPPHGASQSACRNCGLPPTKGHSLVSRVWSLRAPTPTREPKPLPWGCTQRAQLCSLSPSEQPGPITPERPFRLLGNSHSSGGVSSGAPRPSHPPPALLAGTAGLCPQAAGRTHPGGQDARPSE